MATVTLSDVYEPTTFEQLTQEASTNKNAFIQSGVISEDVRLTEMASSGGRSGDMPAYNPMTNNEPNYSSDNNASFSTPDGLGDSLQRWRLAAMNNSWSAMDLSRELGLADPVVAINDSIGGYWAHVEQSRLVNSCLGVLADNVAGDSSDMLFSVATDASTAITDAERVSPETIIRAAATMGDKQTEYVAMAIHSALYTQLRLLEKIDFITDSKTQNRFAMYQDMFLIVDDDLPAIAGTNRITYTSILFKANVFGQGSGKVLNASEIERKASSGDGGGETVIYSRMSKIIHPWGLDFLSATVTGKSPSYAELRLAANWNRVFNRKNVGFSFMQTNG